MVEAARQNPPNEPAARAVKPRAVPAIGSQAAIERLGKKLPGKKLRVKEHPGQVAARAVELRTALIDDRPALHDLREKHLGPLAARAARLPAAVHDKQDKK